VVVGLSMGGQDVVYVKQDRSSPLSPAEIKAHLNRLGDQLFTGACAMPPLHCKSKDKFKVVLTVPLLQIFTLNKMKLC
jgi:hypothetical protein